MNALDDTERLTESMMEQIILAARKKPVSNAQIAESLGLGKPWVSKLLNKKLKTIKLSHLNKLEELLGIQLTRSLTGVKRASSLANRMAARIDEDSEFAKLAAALEDVLDRPRKPATLPWVPTQDMTRIGQEIIRICFADEDKPGKVAKLVLRLLATETAEK